jgi:hypothetical protein
MKLQPRLDIPDHHLRGEDAALLKREQGQGAGLGGRCTGLPSRPTLAPSMTNWSSAAEERSPAPYTFIWSPSWHRPNSTVKK